MTTSHLSVMKPLNAQTHHPLNSEPAGLLALANSLTYRYSVCGMGGGYSGWGHVQNALRLVLLQLPVRLSERTRPHVRGPRAVTCVCRVNVLLHACHVLAGMATFPKHRGVVIDVTCIAVGEYTLKQFSIALSAVYK